MHKKSESADFRVLYKLFNSEVPEGEQSYDLFPGFDNLLDTDGDGFGDEVINAARIVVDQMQRLDQVQMVNF